MQINNNAPLGVCESAGMNLSVKMIRPLLGKCWIFGIQNLMAQHMWSKEGHLLQWKKYTAKFYQNFYTITPPH